MYICRIVVSLPLFLRRIQRWIMGLPGPSPYAPHTYHAAVYRRLLALATQRLVTLQTPSVTDVESLALRACTMRPGAAMAAVNTASMRAMRLAPDASWGIGGFGKIPIQIQ